MARNSFLLASSILCLYTSANITGDGHEQDLGQTIFTSLKQAHTIWTRVYSLEYSMDAAKAAKAVEIILEFVPQCEVTNGTENPGTAERQGGAPKDQGIASIHSLLMQNSAVDYTGISARQGV